MATKKRPRVIYHLDDDLVALIKGRLADPANKGIYDQSADGKELITEQQKVVRYFESTIMDIAARDWMSVTQKAADEAAEKAEVEVIRVANVQAILDQKARDERMREIDAKHDICANDQDLEPE